MWYLLSLSTAFFLATADAVTKRYFSGLPAAGMGFVRLTATLPWLLATTLFIPWPATDRIFWGALAAALPLEVLAYWSYMRALKVSPLSLSLPFLSFTPAFMLLTGWAILGERVSGGGLGGILLIVAGSWLLNLSSARQGLLMPFRAVFREEGSRLMLGVSFIYSLTAVLGKLAILHSSPLFFGIVYNLAFTALFLMLFSPGGTAGAAARAAGKSPVAAVLLGVFLSLSVFSHMTAIAQVQAAYMISLKRISLLIGVLYGAIWFREEKIAERLLGGAVMLAGAILIGWLG